MKSLSLKSRLDIRICRLRKVNSYKRFCNQQGIWKRMPVWDGVLDIAVQAAVSEVRMCSKVTITVMNTYVGITAIYFFLWQYIFKGCKHEQFMLWTVHVVIALLHKALKLFTAHGKMFATFKNILSLEEVNCTYTHISIHNFGTHPLPWYGGSYCDIEHPIRNRHSFPDSLLITKPLNLS